MKTLVTGGGGFLGKALVSELLRQGHEVRSYSRGTYPEVEAMGARCIQGDLADFSSVSKALRGCEIVYHAAAKAGVWGPYSEYYRTNVLGTQNVLDACRRRGVQRLVYTSTPSVVFDGRDQEGFDETARYPKRFLCAYPRTKAIAEQMVLRANGGDLATVALRPHLIWGPGDTQLVPRVIERGRAGRLRLVGDGRKRVDAVYIDNAVHAHTLAGMKLAPGALCAGKVYFVTNDEPMPFAEILNGILGAGGVEPVTKRIVPGLAYAAGAVLEGVYALLRREGEPTMTRFVARQLATAHWYDISAIKDDLGYEARVSMEEGMRRLKADLDESRGQEAVPG